MHVSDRKKATIVNERYGHYRCALRKESPANDDLEILAGNSGIWNEDYSFYLCSAGCFYTLSVEQNGKDISQSLFAVPK